MSYEFHAGDDVANDIPNPFKVENIFLALAASGLMVGGVSTLLAGRDYYAADAVRVAAVSVALAIVMLSVALNFLVRTLSQLRFYLGRKHPRGLAKELGPASEGMSKSALAVIEQLRSGSIEFDEPTGPLNGILYTLIKPLITAPPPVQAAASLHFHALMAALGLLLSKAGTYFLVQGTAHEGVVSWMYLPLTGLSLLTPFQRKPAEEFNAAKVDDSSKQLWKLIGLIAFSVLAPVMVPHSWSAYLIPPMWIAPLLLLVTTLVVSSMFLGALRVQLDDARQTVVSCEQTTISMNCHPAQLWPKVSRDLQSMWVRNTPNRAYANVRPGATDCERGAFQGYILEETQPTPAFGMGEDAVRAMFAGKATRWLIALNAWAAILCVGAGAVGIYFVPQFAEMGRLEISRIVLTVIALTVSAGLAFRAGHLLWSRMYFKSRLLLVVIDGTYQQGEVRIGNQFSGNVQSRATVTRVEDATLRIWVADVISVAFGKDARRFIMSMTSADGFAKSTAEGLKLFAAQQSSVASPTAAGDLEKAQQLMAFADAIAPAAGIGLIRAPMGQESIAGHR
ncbi:MAG: hypothetical protein K2X55_13070 [Burkholderiaceae bacterium]|nr:hypothetical protein [Burkholderiaceae bacterium]